MMVSFLFTTARVSCSASGLLLSCFIMLSSSLLLSCLYVIQFFFGISSFQQYLCFVERVTVIHHYYTSFYILAHARDQSRHTGRCLHETMAEAKPRSIWWTRLQLWLPMSTCLSTMSFGSTMVFFRFFDAFQTPSVPVRRVAQLLGLVSTAVTDRFPRPILVTTSRSHHLEGSPR